MTELRRYTRWTRAADGTLDADILSGEISISASPSTGSVGMTVGAEATLWLSPDEARLYGVRLIEAATLADAHRSIRGGL